MPQAENQSYVHRCLLHFWSLPMKGQQMMMHYKIPRDSFLYGFKARLGSCL